MCARVLMPVHVLVPPPHIRIPTRTHTKYSNVIQTLPHGSRCPQIRLHASVREVTRQRLGIRSTQMSTQNMRMLTKVLVCQNKTIPALEPVYTGADASLYRR